MTDKRKRTLRTQLPPRLHDEFKRDLLATLQECAGEFQCSYLADVAFSKYVGTDTAPERDRQIAAIAKWLKTERGNVRTNARLEIYACEAEFRPSRGTLRSYTSEDLIAHARRTIMHTIGKRPKDAELIGSFSGGASTRYKREPGVVARKFMGQADVTDDTAWLYIQPLVLQCTAWWQTNPEVLHPRRVGGNVMFTVPKSTHIDRVAAKEPELNMFAQKAVGDYIRRQLKRSGIDLNDQSINRKLALRASIDLGDATIDLSSASDSVSTSLVSRLLPPAWFELLDAIRSKQTEMTFQGFDVRDILEAKGPEGVPKRNGSYPYIHQNQMFSSMGNGFTFELESLIFWALAKAVAFWTQTDGSGISVYGDDIIVPVKMAKQFAQVMSFFGFVVNHDKSFWSGTFRESCGGHYDRGRDVTPFYVKEPIAHVERLNHALNRLRKWAGQNGGGVCDPRFYTLWSKYAAYVDRRLWGGHNVEDPSRLVTPHLGRFRVVERSEELDKLTLELQDGLYLQSLNALQRQPGQQRCGRIANERGRLGTSTTFHWRDCETLQEVVRSVIKRKIPLASVLTEVFENKWVLRRVNEPSDELREDYPVWLDANGIPK